MEENGLAKGARERERQRETEIGTKRTRKRRSPRALVQRTSGLLGGVRELHIDLVEKGGVCQEGVTS